MFLGYLLEHIIKIISLIKIKWKTHGIESSVSFYGLTIQEETTVINEFGSFVPQIPSYGMK
jgi:hypothetical protein